MKFILTICVLFSLQAYAQHRLKELGRNDSIVFYQCHVEEAIQQLSTVSGQTLTSSPEKFSITEKFILIKDSSVFRLKYYTSSLTVLPNRKFSGLKIREKNYWNFKLQMDTLIPYSGLVCFIEIEKKGRETTEYDFAITKYTTNQIIIKNKKDFRQLVVEEKYILSQKLFHKKF